MNILRTEKLCKSFSNGGVQQHVIRNLDLEITEGDFTVIMGSSGSGKSTLLYALSGMDKPSMGKVFFGDEEIQDYTNDQLAIFRRGRNAHSVPNKNNDYDEYRRATGLEAVFGYLRLCGDNDRIHELFAMITGEKGENDKTDC